MKFLLHTKRLITAPLSSIAFMAMVGSAHSAVITLHDNSFDFAGRLAFAGGTNDTAWWSTNADGGSNAAQQSFASVETSLVSALNADSGGLGAGESYQINSATISFQNNQYGGGTVYLASSTIDFTAARTTATPNGTTAWPDMPGTSASWSGNANSSSAYLITLGSFTVPSGGTNLRTVNLTSFVDDLVNGSGNGRLFLSASPAGSGDQNVTTATNGNWGSTAHWAVTGDNVFIDVDYSVVPEPSSILLAMLGALALLRRRR